MKCKLTYEKVTEKNIDRALKIQRRLFPLENGEDDLKESINKSKKYYKYLEYYLVHNGKFYIGITGIYSYKEYPLDAWLGWYGVLPAEWAMAQKCLNLQRTLHSKKAINL